MMTLIMLNHCQLIYLLTFIINTNTVLCDCGIPGNSKKSKIVSPIKHYYREGDEVTYKCKSKDSAIIIGLIKRECKDDRWTGPIPKCGNLNLSKYEMIVNFNI